MEEEYNHSRRRQAFRILKALELVDDEVRDGIGQILAVALRTQGVGHDLFTSCDVCDRAFMRLSHHHQFCSERCRKIAKGRLKLTHDTSKDGEMLKILLGQQEVNGNIQEVEKVVATGNGFIRRL
jgi:hypothetical protein